jgi:crossover junction endodeoxyribonuclease RuvC
MFVMGIDQSKRHTGVCVLATDGTLASTSLIEPPKTLKADEHLLFIRERLTQILKNYSPKIIVMEGYSFSSLNKKFDLGEVGAVVKLCAHDAQAQLYVCAPTLLKKFITGRGDASKDDIRTHTLALYGIDIPDDNEADAHGLAQLALQIHESTTNKRFQLDVVRQVVGAALSKKSRRSTVRAPRHSL